jgi:Mn2+/Fe2+ NRAMP family transporter
MERGLVMVLHSVIISVLLYIMMVFILKQNKMVAENRSVLLGALVLAYMVVFGHGLPTKINKGLL